MRNNKSSSYSAADVSASSSETTTYESGYKKKHSGHQHRRSSARFHRSKVRFMAALFGIAAMAAAAYLSVSIIKGERLAKIGVGGFDLKENAFLNFFYKTQDASGKEIVITSEKVIEKDKNSYIFEKVKSDFAISNKETGTITADQGKVVRGNGEKGSKDVCEFKDNVVMSTKSGLSLRTDKATFDSKNKVISGESPINITKDETKISADKYSFDTNKNILELKKNSKAVSRGREVVSEQMTIYFDNSKSESIKKVVAKGNVSLKSADYDLYARDNLTYDNDRIEADRSVSLLYKKDGRKFNINSYKMKAFLRKKSGRNKVNLGEASEISEIFADGNVKIKTRDSIVKADHAVYKKNDGKVLAYGNVVISRDVGDVFGERAEMDLRTGKVSIKKSSGVVGDSWIKK